MERTAVLGDLLRLGVDEFQVSAGDLPGYGVGRLLIARHKDSSTTYLPLGEAIPLDCVVRKDWTETAIFTPDKGPPRAGALGVVEQDQFQSVTPELLTVASELPAHEVRGEAVPGDGLVPVRAPSFTASVLVAAVKNPVFVAMRRCGRAVRTRAVRDCAWPVE
ncbi:hypothetical protein ACWDY4_43380 [Streptomyces olivaceoviridis]